MESVRRIDEAIAAFGETLIAKSPRTATNYRSALNRFVEHLAANGVYAETAATVDLPADSLERFYTWLLKTYGRPHKATALAYVAGTRAFFRYLDRQRWLAPGISYERMKDGLRELIGRTPYRTPRVDSG